MFLTNNRLTQIQILMFTYSRKFKTRLILQTNVLNEFEVKSSAKEFTTKKDILEYNYYKLKTPHTIFYYTTVRKKPFLEEIIFNLWGIHY